MSPPRRQRNTRKPFALRYYGSLRSAVLGVVALVSVYACCFGEAAFVGVGSSLNIPHHDWTTSSFVGYDSLLRRSQRNVPVVIPTATRRGSAILQMGMFEDLFNGAKKYGKKDNNGKEKELTKEEEYKMRLQEAARDPITFEKFVLSGGLEYATTDSNNNDSSLPTSDAAMQTNGTEKQKKGYQRAEDWEAEQNANAEGGNMTWEEKVQFEGQRNGNKIRQNEILRQSIKLWG